MAEAGERNMYHQELVRKTNERGNHRFAKLWILRCGEPGCGRLYEANSCDFHNRRCPDHGGRGPSLSAKQSPLVAKRLPPQSN